MFLFIFLFATSFTVYANQEPSQIKKKWVIASVSEGKTLVDNGLLKIVDQDSETQKRKQIESQLGFLSHQLGKMPEMPEIESLEGMPQIPDMKGKTFDYPGLQVDSEK